jgi:hypothetical protein
MGYPVIPLTGRLPAKRPSERYCDTPGDTRGAYEQALTRASWPPSRLPPVAVEAKLRQPVNDLASAQAALRQARDLEVDARHEYDRARRRAFLSEKSPKVT